MCLTVVSSEMSQKNIAGTSEVYEFLSQKRGPAPLPSAPPYIRESGVIFSFVLPSSAMQHVLSFIITIYPSKNVDLILVIPSHNFQALKTQT